MSTFSLQETFEAVSKGLLSQPGPSLDQHSNCAYRGLGGCRCAAGWLIPDEHYSVAMEGKVSTFIDDEETFYGHDVKLVRALQMAHDSVANNLSGQGFAEESDQSKVWHSAIKVALQELAAAWDLDASLLDLTKV